RIGGSPFPQALIPPGRAWRHIVEEDVVAPFGHFLERSGPTAPGPPRGTNDQGVLLGADLDFAVQAGLFEQGLGDAKALRVADADNARFHGEHPSVITM